MILHHPAFAAFLLPDDACRIHTAAVAGRSQLLWDAACLSVPYEMLEIRSEGMAGVGAACVVSS